MGRLETNNVQVYFHFCISTQEVFYVGIEWIRSNVQRRCSVVE
jgi:hypothetical protein